MHTLPMLIYKGIAPLQQIPILRGLDGYLARLLLRHSPKLRRDFVVELARASAAAAAPNADGRAPEWHVQQTTAEGERLLSVRANFGDAGAGKCRVLVRCLDHRGARLMIVERSFRLNRGEIHELLSLDLPRGANFVAVGLLGPRGPGGASRLRPASFAFRMVDPANALRASERAQVSRHIPRLSELSEQGDTGIRALWCDRSEKGSALWPWNWGHELGARRPHAVTIDVAAMAKAPCWRGALDILGHPNGQHFRELLGLCETNGIPVELVGENHPEARSICVFLRRAPGARID